jgi:TolB-like protein
MKTQLLAVTIALSIPLTALAEEGGGEAKCSVAVLKLQPQGLPEDQAHVPEILTDSIATELASSTDCRIVTEADIASMLDFEAQKMSCGDASASCLAEIGGALGVERVLAGNVGKLGSSFTMQLKLIDIGKAEVLDRVELTVDEGDAGQLRTAARNGARKLYGLDVESSSTSASSAGEPSAGGDGGGGGLASSPFLWTGVGLLGVGALVGIGGLAGGMYADIQLGDPKATGKADIQTVGLVSSAVGMGGGVIALIGAGLLPLAFLE